MMIKRHLNKFPDQTESKLFFKNYVLLAEFSKKKIKMKVVFLMNFSIRYYHLILLKVHNIVDILSFYDIK